MIRARLAFVSDFRDCLQNLRLRAAPKAAAREINNQLPITTAPSHVHTSRMLIEIESRPVNLILVERMTVDAKKTELRLQQCCFLNESHFGVINDRPSIAN